MAFLDYPGLARFNRPLEATAATELCRDLGRHVYAVRELVEPRCSRSLSEQDGRFAQRFRAAAARTGAHRHRHTDGNAYATVHTIERVGRTVV